MTRMLIAGGTAVLLVVVLVVVQQVTSGSSGGRPDLSKLQRRGRRQGRVRGSARARRHDRQHEREGHDHGVRRPALPDLQDVRQRGRAAGHLRDSCARAPRSCSTRPGRSSGRTPSRPPRRPTRRASRTRSGRYAALTYLNQGDENVEWFTPAVARAAGEGRRPEPRALRQGSHQRRRHQGDRAGQQRGGGPRPRGHADDPGRRAQGRDTVAPTFNAISSGVQQVSGSSG